MKVIFNCYSCGEATEHELTDVAFKCECGNVSSTTLSPNNADVVVLRDLSSYDFRILLEQLLDQYTETTELGSLRTDLQLTQATLWMGFTTGKIKGETHMWGPAVCELLDLTIDGLSKVRGLVLYDDYNIHEVLYRSYLHTARINIQLMIDILKS